MVNYAQGLAKGLRRVGVVSESVLRTMKLLDVSRCHEDGQDFRAGLTQLEVCFTSTTLEIPSLSSAISVPSISPSLTHNTGCYNTARKGAEADLLNM